MAQTHIPGNNYGRDGFTGVEPFGCCVLSLEGSRGPARSTAGFSLSSMTDPEECRERDLGLRVRWSVAEREEEMGLAVVTGFSVLTSAIQFGR